MSAKCWLMKAEPDSRVVKGKDVKVRSESGYMRASGAKRGTVVQRRRFRDCKDNTLGRSAEC
ncbi:hypothetical protein C8Q80DRAFT_1210303 [Daedaleopsis nitida]|nr:hypothetical protein C8Q80DRAFT_1210303 [Daedaleopsis nitida]